MKLQLADLQQDSWLKGYCQLLVSGDIPLPGRFLGIPDVQVLYEKMAEAHWEKVKHLPHSGLSIYRTSDLGEGLVSQYSLDRFRELVALQKAPEGISVSLTQFHGNVRASVRFEDLSVSSLVTDEVYLFYMASRSEVYGLSIGKPSNPNRLFYRFELWGKRGTLSQISQIPGLSRINVDTVKTDWIP